MVSNPRLKFEETLRDNRWRRPDPNVPNVWERPRRGFLGNWNLKLNYRNPETWSSDDRLRGLELRHIADGAEQKLLGEKVLMRLNRPDGHGGYNPGQTYLWKACGRNARGEIERSDAGRERILRVRAEILVKNPDLAVWIAAELYAAAILEKKAREAKFAAGRAEREKPFPVTANQTRKGYRDSEWDLLVSAVRDAADQIRFADGRSDMRALVRQLMRATEAINAVMIWDGEEQQPKAVIRPAMRRRLDL